MADRHAARIKALASLAVGLGANVAEGQTVLVNAGLVDAPLVRAIARAAYRRGAHRVDVRWEDPAVRRIRLEEADDAALGQVSPWVHEIPSMLGALQGAAISLIGDSTPGLF